MKLKILMLKQDQKEIKNQINYYLMNSMKSTHLILAKIARKKKLKEKIILTQKYINIKNKKLKLIKTSNLLILIFNKVINSFVFAVKDMMDYKT